MVRKSIHGTLTKIRRINSEKQYSELGLITTREQLVSFQREYLEKLLLHAYKNVPYYHRTLGSRSVIKNSKVNLSKFSEIPILTKEIVRSHHKDLVSKDYTARR